jgi:L-aminopeptidase/D-esterase-like protein
VNLHDDLTDVAGLAVGHAALAQRASGCTVVLCEGEGAVCGVAQRGGAPGTRETDLLRPENWVSRVHAVLLTGGSAFGLDAAGGVMRWLEERGRGVPVGASLETPMRVPIVPAAVLFDLWVGDARLRPDAATGYAACQAAGSGPIEQGNFGAGAGATVGKLYGLPRAMKGGIGSAAVRLGGVTVAALVAANPIGDVLDEDGRVLAGARVSAESDALMHSNQALLRGDGPPAAMAAMRGTATTIGVVATDARLDKAQATQLASLAHAGLGRAISPLTLYDGDTLFALSTGTVGRVSDLSTLGALAAECVARAIRRAVLAAAPLADPYLPAAGARRAG